jgi:murein DD-endopeptidase MepM/ murein hydrolase activator NlpD
MRLFQTPDPKKRGAILVALLLLLGGSLFFLTRGALNDAASPFFWRKPPADRPADATDTARQRDTHYIVQKGDTLFNILSGCGVSGDQIDRLAKSVRLIYNLASLDPGNAVKICLSSDTPVRVMRINYEIDRFNELEVTNENGVFTALKKTHEVEVRLERAKGRIQSNLYESAIGAGVPPEIVMDLTDIFAWDINFFTDIREGDSYTVLYERYYVQGIFKGYGKIVAASFFNQGKELIAIRYRDEENNEGYYDEEGRPIRKLFLKAPLNFRRISSGFTLQRKHPIFQVMKPHLGVDYAAPAGTPVVALGKGVVIFKGWAGGFGNHLQISHPSGYVTYYGHLSSFAKGIAKGSQVGQGEVIGYVGATGVATGPHLDFRVRLNGKFINPLTLSPVNILPLQKEALNSFQTLCRERLAMLRDPLNPTVIYKGLPPAQLKKFSARTGSGENLVH